MRVFAICGRLHCTRYDFCFQTKSKCIAKAAPLSDSCQCGLPLVDYKGNQIGKCETCGFLSKHARLSSAPPPRFYEITQKDRREPETYSQHFNFGVPGTVHTDLACFVRKANLPQEIHAARTGISDRSQQNEQMYNVVRRDRKCDGWFPYWPGFNPKEHYEDLQMQRLELDRRAFEKSLADTALSAQLQSAAIAEKNAAIQEKNAEIAEASKQLVGELKEIAQKSDKSSKRIAWVVIILAVAQVIVGFIALYHESYTDQFLKRIFGPLTR